MAVVGNYAFNGVVIVTIKKRSMTMNIQFVKLAIVLFGVIQIITTFKQRVGKPAYPQ